MRDELTIRVPTPQLQKLIEGAPDILLKLESHACEKIAEEITSKVARRSASMDQEIAQRAERVIQDQFRRLNSTYDMPVQVRGAIDELAKARIGTELKAATAEQSRSFQREADAAIKLITKNRNDATADIKAAAQKFVNEAHEIVAKQGERVREKLEAEMRIVVREEARAAFIDVLRDVKNGTVGIF